MQLLNELQGLMVEYRFRPKRKLGQNFLVNEDLAEKLVGLAALKKTDRVLEIGPGAGFLTRLLLKQCPVVAVELDTALCRLLEERLAGKNFTLVCGDFLEEEIPEFNKVVSLPPYSQSSAIMQKLLLSDFELGVLVFQKEFAEKLVALPGFRQYCALSVLVQHFFEAEEGQLVSPASFYPRPKEKSRVVTLRARSPDGEIDRPSFAFFVKTVFRFRNKNLKNALETSRQFLLPRFRVSGKEFEKRASGLDGLEEKVCLLPVEAFAEAFKKLFP